MDSLDIDTYDISIVAKPGEKGPLCLCAGYPVPVTPQDIHEAWVWSYIAWQNRQTQDVQEEAKHRIRIRAAAVMRGAFYRMTAHQRFEFLAAVERTRQRRRELGIEFFHRARKLMH